MPTLTDSRVPTAGSIAQPASRSSTPLAPVTGDRVRGRGRREDVGEHLLARLDALVEADVEPRLDERLLRRDHLWRGTGEGREEVFGGRAQLVGWRRAVHQAGGRSAATYMSPVRSISLAFDRPRWSSSSAASMTEGIPSLTSGRPNRASGEATRTSQARAISNAAPRQYPWTIATVGIGASRISRTQAPSCSMISRPAA